jgi:hypothetical protein
VTAPLPALLAGDLKARCDGCKNCHFIAPCGQLWRDDPRPQMHCRVLGAIAVEVTKHGDYLHTLIPAGCPEHANPGLFELQPGAAKPARARVVTLTPAPMPAQPGTQGTLL